MDRLKKVLNKLTQVTDDEWKVIIAKCSEHISLRLKHRQQMGAHSPQNLGMPAIDYYLQNAIKKLYEGTWDWQFEKYSLEEQLIRMIDSMISEEVRKYKTDKSQAVRIFYKDDISEYETYLDIYDPEDIKEREEQFQNFINTIEQAIEGDEDLELLFILIHEGKSLDEICEELEWKKQKLYKLIDKLKTKTKSFVKKKEQIQ